MSAKLTCPHCEEDFKPKQPVEAGKKIRCPKCGEKFTAPEEENEGAEPDDRKKAKSGRKGKAKAGSNTLMIAGIVGGAVVLLLACGGAGVGIWWFTKSPSAPAKQADKADVAKGSDKTGGPATPGDKVAPNDKSKPPSVNDQAFLNDPKWKSGNEARALIVGTWHYAQSNHVYEFQADGKMWDKSPQVAGKSQFPFTYRITDPQKLSLAGQEYRLLISQDEMYMVTKSSAIGPYRRK